jgi:hypothetical protein
VLLCRDESECGGELHRDRATKCDCQNGKTLFLNSQIMKSLFISKWMNSVNIWKTRLNQLRAERRILTDPLPIQRNARRKGARNELGFVFADCGSSMVPSFGVAHPETKGSRLNEPVLLGLEQNGESRKEKSVICDSRQASGSVQQCHPPGLVQIIRNTQGAALLRSRPNSSPLTSAMIITIFLPGRWSLNHHNITKVLWER